MLRERLPSEHVLSVRQPFAQLILTPGSHPDIPLKWCENRTWTVKNLPPSKLSADNGLPRIMIHAADRIDRLAMEDFEISDPGPTSMILGSVRVLKIIDAGAMVKEYMERGNGFDYDEESICLYQQARKASSGKCPHAKHLEDGVQHVNISEYDQPWYWWFFDNPILLKKPIPCKGKLSLWKYNVSQTAKK